MSTEFSICIANYQGEAIIETCLDSIQSQACSFDIEILVHDDASTDNSAELIASRYPQVKLLRSESNQGYCISNNRLVAASTGKYLLLLNNDTRLHPGALQALWNHAQSTSRIGILSLPQYRMDDGELLDRGQFLDIFGNAIPNKNSAIEQVACVMASCLLMPRSLWDEIGGFPAWFGSIAEDTYLCCVCRLWGYPVQVLREPGYDHMVGGSFGGGKATEQGLSSSYARRALSERNKNRVIAICYPGWFMYLVMAVHIPLLLLEAVILSIAKRKLDPLKTVYWPSIKDLACDRDRIFNERKRVQRNRKIGIRDFLSPFRWRHQKLKLLREYGVPKIE